MPEQSRFLPDRPSLRFLKIEAKRRLAEGEFSSLHDAQAAIAAEHGMPGWAALKQRVEAEAARSPALDALLWVIDRFRDAGLPGWSPPEEAEVRAHVAAPVLATWRADDLVAAMVQLAPGLRAGRPTVLEQAPSRAAVRVGDLRLAAAVTDEPPHLLTGVWATPATGPVTDPRWREPFPTGSAGAVPADLAGYAAAALRDLGLAGLALAGAEAGAEPWVATSGWADLGGDGEAVGLAPGHLLPAVGVSALVTATAVLRLVAEGRLDLDAPANAAARTVRLADDTVTVRELLCHTGGVDDPAELFAARVPEDPAAVTGPVLGCRGPRGEVRFSNGGYAMLGQLVADLTGVPFPQAAADLVLRPLGLASAGYPTRAGQLAAASTGGGAATGYRRGEDGAFVPVPAVLCTIPAVGGLWSSAADLVRLGTGWSRLLPDALVRDALRPQTPAGPGGTRVGLGWLITPQGAVALHAGAGPGAAACLLLRLHPLALDEGGTVRLAVTTSLAGLDPLIAALGAGWSGGAR